MPTIFDEPGAIYTNAGTIADGLTIAATDVEVTNTDSGRIYGGVIFTTGGSTLINQLGGVISLNMSDQVSATLVTGSDGDDTVINAGLIRGTVTLGGGNDLLVDSGSTYGVDLGSGNDVYRFERSQPQFISAEGGSGLDTLVLAGTGNQYWGASLSGFEHLAIAVGGNFVGFSGFQSISLSPSLPAPYSLINLLDCLNPLVDLSVAGQGLYLNRSSLRSISGSEGTDYVSIGFGTSISNGVSLGGGDDSLTLESFTLDDVPTIPGMVSGGQGSDTLTVSWFSGGDRTFDLSSVSGFEKLNVNAWYITDPAIARISDISGLTDIDIGSNVTLVLSDSVNPNGRAGGGYGGGLTLEAGVVINRYAIRDDWWDPGVDLAQGDPALSTTIVNNGTIIGDVRHYIGDDVYDGRNGSVGGTVYGNAGNDTLRGGAGAETFSGGYGADILEGNGGADQLTGGFGFDTFRGTASGLSGDTITDFAAGDRIVITDASLAGFSFSVSGSTLTFTGGSLILTGFAGGLKASAAAGGGVEITIVPDVRNDFNGDGRSDILWRHSSGQLIDWLGTASGGFADNGANSVASVPTNWNVAGIGDFNGDGRDDILWRNVNGQLIDWLGTANGGFADNGANSFNSVATSWNVAGIGDFNGDGRDDILWRHQAGQLIDWLGTANGGFADNGANSFNSVATSWSVAGVGDFNGDGRDDILWRNQNGQLIDWLGTANGGFADNGANSFNSVATSWSVAGIGDFNGDGRDDILWRNVNGQLIDWLGTANGGFADNGANSFTSVPTAWEVSSIGDFNGDGRDDILWRHTSGQLIDWLGTANGGFADNGANSFYSVPTDWQVQPDII